MPCTSQSILFIFQVVKLPLCQAAGNTLINSKGRSKLSFLLEHRACVKLFHLSLRVAIALTTLHVLFSPLISSYFRYPFCSKGHQLSISLALLHICFFSLCISGVQVIGLQHPSIIGGLPLLCAYAHRERLGVLLLSKFFLRSELKLLTPTLGNVEGE